MNQFVGKFLVSYFINPLQFMDLYQCIIVFSVNWPQIHQQQVQVICTFIFGSKIDKPVIE